MRRLSELADDLRARHFAQRPLIFANVWDAASARAVAGAGHPAVATSPAAVAASLGTSDHEQMTRMPPSPRSRASPMPWTSRHGGP